MLAQLETVRSTVLHLPPTNILPEPLKSLTSVLQRMLRFSSCDRWRATLLKKLRRVTLAILITCMHKFVNSVRPPAVKQCSNSKSFNKNDNLLIYNTFVAQQKCPYPAIHGCS